MEELSLALVNCHKLREMFAANYGEGTKALELVSKESSLQVGNHAGNDIWA